MHHIFTFTARIRAGHEAGLETYLAGIRHAVADHPDLPFAKLTKVHFASIFIVPADADGFPAYLVFENNVDGTIAAYIEQLCAVGAAGLHTIFAACEGYTATAPDLAILRAYLWQHLLRPNASFVGNVGRDLARIGREHALVDELGRATDRLIDVSPRPSPERLYGDLRTHVAETDPWALQPKARISPLEIFKRKAAVLAIVPLALLFWPFLLLGTIVLLVHEFFDREDTVALSSESATNVTQHEDHFQQNHFASISTVKPGWFRRNLLKLVLWLVDRLAQNSIGGNLSGLDNIHFAHWVLIDDGRRLLFLTNYDGSWENYLDDFIDKAAAGLTAIWSNVRGFPKTWFLVRGGATDERKFKTIARRTQIPTAVWYGAYLDLTVPTIDNDSAIRDGLATPPRGAEIDRWLQRL